MATIEKSLTDSFKEELFLGTHNLMADQLKFALYNTGATLTHENVRYSTDHEVSGVGYTAGGFDVVSTVDHFNDVTRLMIQDLTISNIMENDIAGGLLYNSTKQNRAIATYAFSPPAVVNGSLLVLFSRHPVITLN